MRLLQSRAQRELVDKIEASRGRLYRMAFAWCHDAVLADQVVVRPRGPRRRGPLEEREQLAVVDLLEHLVVVCDRLDQPVPVEGRQDRVDALGQLGARRRNTHPHLVPGHVEPRRR